MASTSRCRWPPAPGRQPRALPTARPPRARARHRRGRRRWSPRARRRRPPRGGRGSFVRLSPETGQRRTHQRRRGSPPRVASAGTGRPMCRCHLPPAPLRRRRLPGPGDPLPGRPPRCGAMGDARRYHRRGGRRSRWLRYRLRPTASRLPRSVRLPEIRDAPVAHDKSTSPPRTCSRRSRAGCRGTTSDCRRNRPARRGA